MLNVCPGGGSQPGLLLELSSQLPPTENHLVPTPYPQVGEEPVPTVVPCGTTLRTITNGRVLHDLGPAPCTGHTWGLRASLMDVPFVAEGYGDTHTTHVYAVSDAGGATLLGHATSGQDCGKYNGSGGRQRRVVGPFIGVGILYEAWHTFAAAAYAHIKSVGGVQLTVEDVIRSNGGYTLHDIVEKYSVNSDGFYYQATPDLGYVGAWEFVMVGVGMWPVRWHWTRVFFPSLVLLHLLQAPRTGWRGEFHVCS